MKVKDWIAGGLKHDAPLEIRFYDKECLCGHVGKEELDQVT